MNLIYGLLRRLTTWKMRRYTACDREHAAWISFKEAQSSRQINAIDGFAKAITVSGDYVKGRKIYIQQNDHLNGPVVSCVHVHVDQLEKLIAALVVEEKRIRDDRQEDILLTDEREP